MRAKPPAVVLTDRTVLAELLAGWLKDQSNVGSAVAARDADAVLAVARKRPSAIYLLDPGDSRRDAFVVARAIQKADPRGRIGFIAESAAEGWIRRALEVNAAAFIGPMAGLDGVRSALQSMIAGMNYYSPCAARLIAELASPTAQRRTLSPREVAVLQLICEGESSKQIGKKLGLASKTVDFHRARIMSKTGMKSATSLVRYACDQRFVTPR